MLHAIISGVIKKIIELAVKAATHEGMLLSGHEKKLEDLSKELNAIRAVLHDAEMRQIREESIRNWLQDVKFVAYEIEDMLEKWDHESKFSSLITTLKKPLERHKFGSKLNAMKVKLKNIADLKERYKLNSFQLIDVNDVIGQPTSSLVDQSTVIGRDTEINFLERKLVSEDLNCEEGRVPVVSIVGMGGVGKTTLAQVLFNADSIKNYFEKLIWVCVSNEFNTKHIMINIIKNGGGDIVGEHAQDELIQQKVKELIGSKRYLLVLDDVWNEDALLWHEHLQRFLNCGAMGSRIIVTTRNRAVAHASRSAYLHDVGLLSSDDCWSIFKKLVFRGRNNEEGCEEIERVGRKIVEKCAGLPLAVKTIASAIWGGGKYPILDHLNSILRSEIWELESKAGIKAALLLSYFELPSHLKNCFCYCSLFEKDSVLEKDLLIRLWVAQGYILSEGNQKKELERIAEEYFDELLNRSLFQEAQMDDYGSIIGCKMHDLVHDLAQWAAKNEFSAGAGREQARTRHYRVSWNSDFSSVIVKNLRTLICLDAGFDWLPIDVMNRLRSVRVLGIEKQWVEDVGIIGRLIHLRYLNLSWTRIKSLPKSIQKLKQLLYLDVSHTAIKVLPESIGKLEHLRYLNLTETKIESLPESIGKLAELRYLNLSETSIEKLPDPIIYLYHLETLDLQACIYLMELPAGIVKMKSLRHLNVRGCKRMLKLPDGIGRLTLLQTLPLFPVARAEGGGRSNIGELGGLSQIRGQLQIVHLGEFESSNEARSAKLKEKKFLWSLAFSWGCGAPPDKAFDVLDALEPPPQLQSLHIDDYPGGSFPNWIGNATFLPCLRAVTLRDCKNCTQLPSLGQLPCLKELIIYGLCQVEKIGEEFLFGPIQGTSLQVGFPQLEVLEFSHMYNWMEWDMPIRTEMGGSPSAWPTMPRLRELKLLKCFSLAEVPPIFTTALQKLVIIDSPWLRSLQFVRPIDGASNIKDLTLNSCSIKRLLADCPSLPWLQSLSISVDEALKEFPSIIFHSTLLQYLEIYGFPNLVSIPKELVHLSHLECLHIRDCKNMVSLPEELEQMNSLKQLFVSFCGQLGEKLEEGGSLWPRVRHIRDVLIM